MNEHLLKKIAELQSRAESIEQNGDLSFQGKQKQRAQWEAERSAARQDALYSLRYAWGLATHRMKLAEIGGEIAKTRDAGSWNYQRLEYEQRRMESQIANGSLEESSRLFFDAMSADSHKARVWSESAPALLHKKFGTFESGNGADWSAVRQAAAKKLDELVPDDLRKSEEEGKAAAQELVDLARETDRIKEFYDGEGTSDDFAALSANVRFEQRVSERGPYQRVSLAE